MDVEVEELAEAEGVYRLRTQVIAEKENMEAPCVLNQGKYAQVEANDDGTFTVYCTFSNYGLSDPSETEDEGKQVTTWDTIWVTENETEKETPMKWRVLSVDAYGNITLATDPSMGGEERKNRTNLSRITDWSYAGKVDSEGGSEEILPQNLYLSAAVETPEAGKNYRTVSRSNRRFLRQKMSAGRKRLLPGKAGGVPSHRRKKRIRKRSMPFSLRWAQKQAAAVFHKNTQLYVTINGQKVPVIRDADGNSRVRYEFAATAELPPTPSAAPTVSPSAVPTPTGSPAASSIPTVSPGVSASPSAIPNPGGSPSASSAPTAKPDVSAIPSQAPNVDANAKPSDKPAVPGKNAQPGETGQPHKPAQKGEKLQDESGAGYVVAKADSKNPEVAYQKAAVTKGTVIVPDTVEVNGTTYKVTSIEKKAFGTGKKIKTIILGKNVKTIKKDAFAGCKTLRKIIVKTKELTKKTVAKKAFRGVRKMCGSLCRKRKNRHTKKLFYQRGLNKKLKSVHKTC